VQFAELAYRDACHSVLVSFHLIESSAIFAQPVCNLNDTSNVFPELMKKRHQERKREREREREGEGEGEGKRTLFRVKLNLVIISHKYTRINIGLTRIATIIRYANINHYETCTAERNKSRVHRIIPLRRGNYRGREFRRDTPIKTHHGLFPGICIMRK
jgi:hypothetical protein